jgi:hypothetical protein
VHGAAFLAETVRSCGCLPLAVRIAATRLRTRLTWTVEDLLARLREQDGDLTELTIGDRSVAAAFTLSYQRLPAALQRLFRLLALVPGPDFDTRTAAALTGGGVAEIERQVEQLLDLHLLQQPRAGRYRFHALVRTYAAKLATTSDDGNGALTRVFDHYLYATSLAAKAIPAQTARPRPAQADRLSIPLQHFLLMHDDTHAVKAQKREQMSEA